jgi:hypothetical protein
MPTGIRRIAAHFAIALFLLGCKSSPADPPIQGVASAPARGAAPPPTDSPQAVVTASHGKVELSRGASGSWSAVKVGDRLGVRDALRTDTGEADLAVDGVKVRLHEASRLDLKKVDKRAMRTKVRGSLESEVEPTGRLDVEIDDSDATAYSQGGHFFVTSEGRGMIAVAAVTGTVHLTSQGKSVDVNKGEVSRISSPAESPSLPAAALRRVLLSVQWPNVKETNRATVPITGRVEPGSRVFVQGQPVEVEAGGLFRADVPLKQGKQKIAVVTVDALGRRKQIEGTVKRDDSLPVAKVKKKLWQWH